MEIENIIDLCLAGQIELVEEVLKELPKLEKATSSYVRKMYGWAKPFAKMHGQQELPKSVFNGMDLLFVDELFFDWYNKSTKKHKNVSVAALPEKLKMPPKIHTLVFYRIVWEELPAVLFDEQIKKIKMSDCLFKTIPALPTNLKSFEIYCCKMALYSIVTR